MGHLFICNQTLFRGKIEYRRVLAEKNKTKRTKKKRAMISSKNIQVKE